MSYTDPLFFLTFFLLIIFARGPFFSIPIREWILIVFSLAFIASYGFFSLALFLVMLLGNWIFVLAILHGVRPKQRIWILTLGISTNLATLGLFKYKNLLPAGLQSENWTIFKPTHYPQVEESL